jgi:hypothetical protein
MASKRNEVTYFGIILAITVIVAGQSLTPITISEISGTGLLMKRTICFSVGGKALCMIGPQNISQNPNNMKVFDMNGNLATQFDAQPYSAGEVQYAVYFPAGEVFQQDTLIFRSGSGGFLSLAKFTNSNGVIVPTIEHKSLTGSGSAGPGIIFCKMPQTNYAVFVASGSNEMDNIDLTTFVAFRSTTPPSGTNKISIDSLNTSSFAVVKDGLLYVMTLSTMAISKSITIARGTPNAGVLDPSDKNTYYYTNSNYLESFGISETASGGTTQAKATSNLLQSSPINSIIIFGTNLHLIGVTFKSQKIVGIVDKSTLQMYAQCASASGNTFLDTSLAMGQQMLGTNNQVTYSLFVIESPDGSQGRVYKYDLSDTAVAPTPTVTKLVIVSKAWDAKTKIFALTFDEEIDDMDFEGLLAFRLQTSAGVTIKEATFTEIRRQDSRRGIQGQMTTTSEETNMNIKINGFGDVVFKNSAKSYTDLPIVIPVPTYVQYGGHSTPRTATAVGIGGTVQAVTIASAVATPVATSLASSASGAVGSSSISGVMKMVDSLQYLLYENGERIELSDKFLQPFKTNPFEIFPNLFEADEERVQCEPEINFAKENVSCNFLNNYGSDILTLAFCALMYGLIKLIYFLLERFGNKEARYFRWIKYGLYVPALIFRLGFLIELWDGFQIELIQFSLLNMNNFTPTTPQRWGLTFAIILFLAYIGYTALIYFLCARKLALSQNQERFAFMKRFRKLDFLFEHFKPKEQIKYDWMYFIPFARIVRVFLIQLCIVLIADKGMDQVKLIFLIEGCFLFIAIQYNHIEGKWYALSYRVNATGFFLIQFFILLHDYTRKVVGPKTITFYAVMLIILYIVLILSEISVLIVETCLSFIELYNSYKKWRSGQNRNKYEEGCISPDTKHSSQAYCTAENFEDVNNNNEGNINVERRLQLIPHQTPTLKPRNDG